MKTRVINPPPETPPRPPAQSDFFKKTSWSGEIPLQKWMNFYTKVLSKHVTDRNRKLKVTFETTPENGVSKERAEESKAALRGLGLSPDVGEE